jgi:hypothetical protein
MKNEKRKMGIEFQILAASRYKAAPVESFEFSDRRERVV